MAELAGTLANFELVPLVRFLCGLGKSGDLLLSRGRWIGQLSVDHGSLTAAAADNELGRSALEFVAAVMSDGSFEFSEGPPALSPNLSLDADPLVVLERLSQGGPQTWIEHLLGPTAVPQMVETPPSDDTPVTLSRLALFVLRDADGTRNVRSLAARHGLLQTLKALDRLQQLGLVAFEAGGNLPPPRADAGFSPPAGQPPGRESSMHLQQSVARPTGGVFERVTGWRSHFTGSRSLSVATELGQAVLITGLFIFGLRSFVENFRVEGVSMQPTFEGGQALVINRAAYFHVENSPLANVLPTTSQGSVDYVFGGPRRGDVVVFVAPPQPDVDYIKRIIGLPGESILIQHGQVFVNGAQLDESYIQIPATYDFPLSGKPISVPDGNYFVLGDNRPDSFDSHLGWFVPADNLIGRAWLRYWPPSELGVVQSAPIAVAASATQAPGH